MSSCRMRQYTASDDSTALTTVTSAANANADGGSTTGTRYKSDCKPCATRTTGC